MVSKSLTALSTLTATRKRMRSSTPVSDHRASGTRGIDRALGSPILIVCLLLLSAAFLFVDRAAMPIQLWDESRNIVNALEMHARGFSLVTTYADTQDLWNTKPPLLICLMAGSVSVFGPSVWALRLPSMIATLGTIALLFWFVRRATGSRLTAALAAGLAGDQPGVLRRA